ncbi:MAG: hypothetical protein AAF196_16615 [Planctomycetota bacterium]
MSETEESSGFEAPNRPTDSGADSWKTSGFKRGRSARNRRSVQFSDRCARGLITVGGLGTIFAVLGVAVFLVLVVAPLFDDAEFEAAKQPLGLSTTSAGAKPLRIGSDEFGQTYWRLDEDEFVRVLRADTGEVFREIDLRRRESEVVLTAVGGASHGSAFVLGYSDGSIRLCDLAFAIEFERTEGLPPEIVRPGGVTRAVVGSGQERGLVERLPGSRFRKLVLAVELSEVVEVAKAPITDCDRNDRSSAIDVVVLSRLPAEPEPILSHVAFRVEEDLFSGERTAEYEGQRSLKIESERAQAGRWLRFLDAGRGALLVDPRGHALRISIDEDLILEQNLNLVENAEVGRATDVRDIVTLLGGKTLIVGHGSGAVSAWFLVPDVSTGLDRQRLIRTKEFAVADCAVTKLGTSARGRTVVAGDESGGLHLLQVTTEQVLGSAEVGSGPVEVVAFAPKADRILAACGTADGRGGTVGYALGVDLGHPEVSLKSIFSPVAYEGREGPAFAWQTSAASDSYEPKFGLVPLIFGTLKATFYTMLLSIPLALLAAIYTSEFVSKQRRARIKPIVEMMASLPSVVLGFVAAVVLAPFVEDRVAGLIACAVTIPSAVLGAAFLWQSFPLRQTLPRQGLRMPLMAIAVVFGLALGLGSNDWIEQVLFDSDLRLWLSDSDRGSGLPAWLLLTLPFAAVLTSFSMVRFVNPVIRSRSMDVPRQIAARRHLIKWAIGSVAFLGLAFGLAALCYYGLGSFFGGTWDLRDGFDVGGFDLSPVGVYDQRNALVVGLVMGFAVVPIIYTIAEDALSSVPENLRAASLGAGASPWQTAVRVVLPTATSGLFSAIMIGLGRAVGETMIVLMAAGNTPVLDLDVFKGFQTLSAGIATELPEAPAGSTHYRTLFLAALVLFAITFVINSLAEAVRQHYRRKFSQL